MALEDKSGRIDHHSPKVKWQQVADDIEADITSGRLGVGAKLPTELEMASQYGVARITVRRAVKELAERGLLVVVHGRGTFVADRQPGQAEQGEQDADPEDGPS